MGSELREQARRVVGVGGPAGDAGAADRVGTTRGLLHGLLLGTGIAGPIGLLLTGRQWLAEELGVDPHVADDRLLGLLAMAALVVVLGWLVVHDRFPALRAAAGGVAGMVAVALLARPTPDGVLVAALVGGIGLGLVLGAHPVLLADRVGPGGRPLALTGALLGLPMALVIAGAGVVAGEVVTAAAVLGVGGLAGSVLVLLDVRARMARDDEAVRALVTDHATVPEPVTRAASARRLAARPAARSLALLSGLAGLAGVAVPLFLVFHLQDLEAADGALESALVVVGMVAVVAVAGAALLARRFLRRGLAHLGIQVTRLLLVGGVLLAVATIVSGTRAVTVVAAVAVGLALAAVALADVVLFVSLPTRLRPLAATMRGVSITVGAMAGIALLAAIDRRFGTAWTLLVGGVLIASMAALAARAARTADRELDRTLDQALAAEEVADRRRAGQHVPLLECRGIDFAYGSVQVLFDVDFSVDEGEMIALLGTNGAGKSTLLRVISGLGVPQRGAVHLDGRDITFATATDRVQRGISQVPGGKAVFGPMSVVENLRVYGYALGSDRAAVDRGIDTAFEVFPRLNERRNQTAQTLSGGEQQMLALSKALILEPRLLLIDELSLGLAPVIVSQLLDMVRTINERGTAVVLVEQSVNVALSLAQHAYYMEKGEIRFDGPTAQLLERPDVLRSVYLKGAADGLGAGA
jgi:ABC-type branched-subunit amino acid transport system ATPase component